MSQSAYLTAYRGRYLVDQWVCGNRADVLAELTQPETPLSLTLYFALALSELHATHGGFDELDTAVRMALSREAAAAQRLADMALEAEEEARRTLDAERAEMELVR